MKKNMKVYPSVWLFLLMPLIMMTNCNSNGDETISLEFGNPTKIIVGEWIVGPGSRIWAFTEDGHYTDSQDGGKIRHTWQLDSNYNHNEPYYGGIFLDGTYYDIIQLSEGIWRLKNGSSTWELTRNGGNNNDNDSANKGDHDAGGNGKLVNMIIISNTGTRAGSKNQIIRFFYDDNNRVKAVEYDGEDEIVLGPQGYHLDYNINGSTMTLSGYSLVKSSDVLSLPGKGKLNKDGYLEMEYFETYQYEIDKNDYLIDYYDHNNKNQVTKMRIVKSDTGKELFTYNYTWENDCLVHVTGNPGGAGYSSFGYTDLQNKSNINLNGMLYCQMYGEDIYALALCGYICANDKYLIKADWKLDSNGYPISVTHNGYTYNIAYTE